jgi:hypothetical protein
MKNKDNIKIIQLENEKVIFDMNYNNDDYKPVIKFNYGTIYNKIKK